MWKNRLLAVLILIVGFALGYFIVFSEPRANFAQEFLSKIAPASTTVATLETDYAFRLGLDLSGGTRLVYKADLSKIEEGGASEAMDALRDVIERRVNLFGVAEPVVQTEYSALAGERRLIVELPGVTDINRAIEEIGQTPLLEFKLPRPEGAERDRILKAIENFNLAVQGGGNVEVTEDIMRDPNFIETGLDGGKLVRSNLEFDPTTRRPYIALTFNEEGAELFAKLTRENVGKQMYIFLDNAPISAPVIQEEITGGKATITGEFTAQEAKQLVGRLNSGALPVPIALVGSQLVGATLGTDSVSKGVQASLFGFAFVALFLLLWYRLPGLLSVIALSLYVLIMLVLFKFVPVTITASGIAGFIISVGLAVDANILIFERMKEELRAGRTLQDAIANGFARAWTSIRDSNIAHLISAVILFWFGTSIVKGFALTLGIGVIVSMISAIFVSRVFLVAVGGHAKGAFMRFLMANGIPFTRSASTKITS